MARHARLAVASLTLGLLLAGVAPVAPADEKDDEKKLKCGDQDPALLERVNAAVSKATDGLLAAQKPDGHWTNQYEGYQHGPMMHGGTALTLLALLHGGVSAVDDKIELGFAFLKERWKNFMASGRVLHTKASWHTYEVGLALMAIEARVRWKPASLRHKKGTEALQAGVRMAPDDWEWVKQMRDYLVDHVASSHSEMVGPGKKGGTSTAVPVKDAWAYPTETNGNSGDRSNTQYAVLGLKSASRMTLTAKRADLRPPAELWVKILANHLEFQEQSGPRVPRVLCDAKSLRTGDYLPTRSTITDEARGWAYSAGMAPDPNGHESLRVTGSMTCVGIACCELAWSELDSARKGELGWSADDRKAAEEAAKEHRKAYERAVHDGFAWMTTHFAVDKNPENQSWHYYYLYGLERACVLAQRPNVGDHDWYREGAEYLLANQRGAGWQSAAADGPENATCFAILFLTRATIPVKGAVTGH